MYSSMLDRGRVLLPTLFVLAFETANAAPPPIDAFARIPAIRNVAVSPDAKQLLYITGAGDIEAVVTAPTSFEVAPKPVFASDPGEYELNWCGWANNKRILCSVSATVREGPFSTASRAWSVSMPTARIKRC